MIVPASTGHCGPCVVVTTTVSLQGCIGQCIFLNNPGVPNYFRKICMVWALSSFSFLGVGFGETLHRYGFLVVSGGVFQD